MRTAADGVSGNELASDIRFLQRLWRHIEQAKTEAATPSCLYEELPLYKRVLRDIAS